MKISKIAVLVQKLLRFLLNWCSDYSALRHLGNRNLNWESAQNFTRRLQTPDEGRGTLCGKFGTQEVFDGFHLSGKIEGSQTPVVENFENRQLHYWPMIENI